MAIAPEHIQKLVAKKVAKRLDDMAEQAMTSTWGRVSDPGPLTADSLLAAMSAIPKVPATPPVIRSTPHWPLKVTGYRRDPIMCHPLIRWFQRRLGRDEQWGWGPWQEIRRPADPIMFDDPWTGQRVLMMHPEQERELLRAVEPVGAAA